MLLGQILMGHGVVTITKSKFDVDPVSFEKKQMVIFKIDDTTGLKP
jgi:hypothetical protein